MHLSAAMLWINNILFLPYTTEWNKLAPSVLMIFRVTNQLPWWSLCLSVWLCCVYKHFLLVINTHTFWSVTRLHFLAPPHRSEIKDVSVCALLCALVWDSVRLEIGSYHCIKGKLISRSTSATKRSITKNPCPGIYNFQRWISLHPLATLSFEYSKWGKKSF